ncbi:unnamed protein product (macronuclear) [Paramecium tetraurelia]|uniref:Kelch motif family protein n=1 Tax=Paramecium tetraurelia TaxID=5888 RepID=A0CPK6_PARTE|nr:uncharacterized protein GSPATT00009115001 [Paramecium tetraurelia]CAK72723.1 unnamed protein product [Paramecium tetraurelia]|eukprot:XP_001440120.1 hypothetical protein (macronuclear) [Paramecium tetraurelia strain d4-2]
MIQQQVRDLFSFTPILQSTSLDDDQLPSYSTYAYDLYEKKFRRISKFVNFDQLNYVPFYAASVRISNTNDFLITGGAVLQEDNQDQYFSTNFCMKITVNKDSVLISSFDSIQQQQILPSLIYPRHNHKIFELILNDKRAFIVVGGQYVNSNEFGVFNSCEMLIEGSNEWIQIAPLQKNRTGFSGFVQNNKIYIFCGISGFNEKKHEIIPPTQIEVYNPEKNEWEQIKYKCPLGITIGLDCLCLPINDNKVLILGGSKEQSSDQILIMDQDKKAFTKHPQKLSIPKAKCYGRFSRNIVTKKIIREENQETIQEEQKNLIIILGGSSYQLDLEIYQLLDEDNLQIKLLQKYEFGDVLDQDYEINGLPNKTSWNFVFQSLPILSE